MNYKFRIFTFNIFFIFITVNSLAKTTNNNGSVFYYNKNEVNTSMQSLNNMLFAPVNDDCSAAITLVVNTDSSCNTTLNSSLTNATGSPTPNACTGTANDDIWFEFTATSSVHAIHLTNITGTVPLLSGTLFSGTCGSLIQYQCITATSTSPTTIFNNLTIGSTYKIRIFSTMTVQNTVSTFNICITTLQAPLKVTAGLTGEQLLNNLLNGNECISYSNISTRTDLDNPFALQYPTNIVNGIGGFNKNNSLFPFDNGIVLSTGNVELVPGPKTVQDNSSGSTFWQGDQDINNLLQNSGISGASLHASVLEFDFTSSSDYISIDYILASDEYGSRCSTYDITAFFLTDLVTGNTQNIATVPNTQTIVTTATIRDGAFQQYNINCSSENAQYFGDYYNGLDISSQNSPINFRGSTVPLKAEAAIIPNRNYHLKLVVAEHKLNFTSAGGNVIYYDANDTAVFIANIRSTRETLSLGNDLLVSNNTALCHGEQFILNTNLNSLDYTFQWYRNNEIVPNETGVELVVTKPGIYMVKAYYKQTDCYRYDTVNIEYYPDLFNDTNIPSIETCVFNNNVVNTIDLTQVENFLYDQISADTQLTINYYMNEQNALDNVNRITNPGEYQTDGTEELLYVSVKDNEYGCLYVMPFVIIPINISTASHGNNITACTKYKLPILPTNFYYSKEALLKSTIVSSGTEYTSGSYQLFLNYEGPEGCTYSSPFNIVVNICTVPKGFSPNGDGLNDSFNLSPYTVLSLKIYNRYGNEVYSYGEGYKDQWIGQTLNGSLLPTGTYYYKIETAAEVLTGYIYLSREHF